MLDNLRPDGALRWKAEDHQLGRSGGGCDVENWHLQGCSSCLCRLRTDGLVPRASIECTNRMSELWVR
jgi:hypothetical protein